MARKKYDASLKALATSTSKAQANRPTTRTTRTTFERSSAGKAQKEAKEKQSGNTSQQTKLLMKIYELLKRFPRDLRQEVISKFFSQQQRLILEKWMVDMVKTREAQAAPQAPQAALAAASSTDVVTEQRFVAPDTGWCFQIIFYFHP